MKVPENSDESEPPASLDQTEYTCACGAEFDDPQALGEHTETCEDGQYDGEE